MNNVRYVKPNMINLRGKRGRAILKEIRNSKVMPMDDIRRDADACMKRILARREEKVNNPRLKLRVSAIGLLKIS